MRHWVAIGVCVLAACGKKDGDDKQRIKGAQRANVERLLVGLGYVSEEPRADMLAQAIAEECGAACDCIRISDEASDHAAKLATCPSDPLPADQAKLVDPLAWIVADVAGKYLADQLAAAGKQADALAEAMAALQIPLGPGAGLGGVMLGQATQLDALPRAQRFLAIGADGKLRSGPMPVARLTKDGAVLDLGKIEDDPDLTAALQDPAPDEPPPPEPEPEPEPGVEDELGTGAAMALEEGKMGKKDSDRAEGQYKMKNNNADPQLARAQALEQARTAGILGSATFADGTPALGDHKVVAAGQRGPFGFRDEAVLVLADRGAPAERVAEVLMATPSSVLAVEHDGRVAALPLVFTQRTSDGSVMRLDEDKVDLELVVTAQGVRVGLTRVGETLGDVPFQGETIDGDAVTKALRDGFDSAFLAGRSDVVVAIQPGAKTSHLLAALDAALAAGASSVTVWDWVAPRKVRFGQPTGSGDLDKSTVRRHVEAKRDAIEQCYTTALAATPDLAGDVTAQFLIAPNGTVQQANAKGVSADVSSCVAAVLEAIEFPKPRGGGPVNVTSFPMTFSP